MKINIYKRLVVIVFSIFFLLLSFATFEIVCDWKVPQIFFVKQSKSGDYLINLSDIHSPTLGKYYISFISRSASKISDTFDIDENGIRVVNYGNNIGRQYNPVSISQYALANWELWLDTRKPHYKNIFERQANWLLDNQKITPMGFGVWYYNFDYKPYGLKHPWISSMAQGQAISVLLRAYQLTNRKEFLNAAQNAINALKYPIENGGVRSSDKDMNVFFEEYPSVPPSHVLNGFIFTLFGVYDYYRATGDPESFNLFNAGIATLEKKMKFYDTGYWSLYDLTLETKEGKVIEPSLISGMQRFLLQYEQINQLSNRQYHDLHIAQLLTLYQMTKNIIFKTYMDRWGWYRDSSTVHLNFMFHIFLDKARIKLISIFSNLFPNITALRI